MSFSSSFLLFAILNGLLPLPPPPAGSRLLPWHSLLCAGALRARRLDSRPASRSCVRSKGAKEQRSITDDDTTEKEREQEQAREEAARRKRKTYQRGSARSVASVRANTLRRERVCVWCAKKSTSKFGTRSAWKKHV